MGHGGRHDLIEASLRVAKTAAERRFRHEAKADLVGNENHGISGDAEKAMSYACGVPAAAAGRKGFAGVEEVGR